MATLMKSWQEGFRRYHPAIRFETKLMGTGTGVAGLYSGVADLALMGRDITPTEVMAFEWVFRYKPLSIEAATGSLGVPGKTFAPGVFVHKDNPLTKLTLAQLDAIFGCEHRRGPRNIRTWGELGLTGEWKDKPINAYGYNVDSGTATFFRQVVLDSSYKWNCDVKEFAVLNNSEVDPGKRVLDALAKDRYGIAFSNLGSANSQVKPVALALKDEGAYFELTRESVLRREYPLTRAVSIVINRAPGKPVDPKVKEFLRYILSHEGQRDVVREGDYLPLTREFIGEQLHKLD
jgi:phosphate transport system substrate-binding protein